jgi:hypothetical protein
VTAPRTITAILRQFGAQPSRKSRQAMAHEIARLDAIIARMLSCPSVEAVLDGEPVRVVRLVTLVRAAQGWEG